MATRDVVVRFLGNAAGLDKAAEQGEKAVGKFSDRTQKMATAGLAGVAAFGAGMVSMLKGGVEGLREGEEAEARFTQAMSKVPAAVGASSEAIRAHAEAIQANTRFAYEDALAVSGMLAAQDGVQKAVQSGAASIEQLTSVSLDLATVQGKDGPAAAAQLAKWMAAPEKAAGALRKAGISLTGAEQAKIKAWTESGQVAQAQGLILDKVRAKTEGAAKAAGQTTAGQLERAQAAWGEVQESLATQVIPVITKLVGWLLKVTTWMQNNPGKVKVIVIALGSLAAVIGTVSLAIKAWTFLTKIHTAVMWALNVAMNANPAVRIAMIIGLLAAAVVIAWKRSETFRRIVTAAFNAVKSVVTGAFNAIKGAAAAVWNWIKGNWPLLLAVITGPIGLAVLFVVKNFDRIKAAASAVFGAVSDAVGKSVDFVAGMPGKILGALKSLGGDLKTAAGNAIAGFVQGIKDKAGDIVNTIKEFVTDKIPGFVKKALGIGSPSKVTARLGRFIAEGFVVGIKGSKAALERATEQMMDGLRAKVDRANEIAAGIRSAFSVDLSATDVAGKGPTLVERLAAQAKQAEAFTAVIERLRRAGLRESARQQLIGEGPGALAAATEALGNVSTINRLTGRIGAAGNLLATREAQRQTGVDLAGRVDVQVKVELDGKELRAIVQAEKREADRRTKRAASAGARRAG